MDPVVQMALMLAALLLLGALGEFIFSRTGVPDMIWLVAAGIVAGPVFKLLKPEIFTPILPFFGAIALMLAAAGLYGVVSFTLSRRTRDIGVRMALGADRRVVARQILGGGLRMAGAGIVLGIVGALALGRFTEALLYDVEPSDPLPFAASCAALLAVTTLACLLPARRATRVDPVEAIRAE